MISGKKSDTCVIFGFWSFGRSALFVWKSVKKKKNLLSFKGALFILFSRPKIGTNHLNTTRGWGGWRLSCSLTGFWVSFALAVQVTPGPLAPAACSPRPPFPVHPQWCIFLILPFLTESAFQTPSPCFLHFLLFTALKFRKCLEYRVHLSFLPFSLR